MEAQSAVLESLLETSDKLTAKNSRQRLAGKKEPVLRSNPVGVTETQSASGNDVMDMRMQAER